jgi:hypothetical protein
MNVVMRLKGLIRHTQRKKNSPAPAPAPISTMDYDARMAQTMEALKDPQVGDRFHEMYSFWMFVLVVTPAEVTFMTASPPCSLPDDGKIATLTRELFIKKFTYQSIPDKSYLLLADRGNNVAGWLKVKD